MTNSYNPIFWLASLGNDIQFLFHLFGQWEFLPSNNLISWLGHYFCDVEDHPVLGELCGNIAFIIAGIDESQMNAYVFDCENISQRARKFKKFQAKKLMKSNKSISQKKFFLSKFHFLPFQKWSEINF